MKMLYEVAVIEHPKKKKGESKGMEKLIFGPDCVIAGDEQQAAISTILDNAGKFDGVDRDRMEVLVRPF